MRERRNACWYPLGTHRIPLHYTLCVITLTPLSSIRALISGDPGCSKNTGKGTSEFDLLGQVTGQEISIDFSPKGGPEFVQAKWDDNDGKPGIIFPDGNKWMRK